MAQVLTLLAALGASPVTRAAVITVDQVNCNLVDAITAANNDAPIGGCPAGSGEDTLRLHEAVYTLTQVNNGAGDFYTYDANGLPVITSPIVLSGARSGSNGSGVVIERSAAPETPAFRLIDVNVGGSLVIQGVTLRNGYAAGGNVAPEGAGIRNAGRLRLIRSTVEGGRSASARPAAGIGGIFNGPSGVADLSGSVVTGNNGGIRNLGALSLRDSTVSNNAKGVASPYELNGIENSATVSMENSTVSGNAMIGFVNSGTADVTNSTISGNGAGGFVNNRAIGWGDAKAAVATLTQVTVAGNTTMEWGPVVAGGVSSIGPGQLKLVNSLVAGNVGGDCATFVDALGTPGSVAFSGVNLMADGSCNAAANGSLTADPMLGALSHNGGPTLTQALLSGSPAIDAADDGFCTQMDQRGVPRPQGPHCDIGSFEVLKSAMGSWPLNAGDRSYLGDFNGDGKDDIFVRSANSAGVLSYDGTRLSTRTVISEWIGGWKLSPDDQSYVGDFDGDGQDEIFVRTANYAGILSYQGFQLTTPTIASGWVGGWQLGPGDKSYVGDFDGDGRDEIFVQSWIYAGILRYDGSSLTSEAIVIGGAGNWPLNINDHCYVGDFNGDGNDELFVRSVYSAGLISYDGVQLHGENVAFGSIGSWQLGSADQSYVGDFDGDGQDDIFVTTYRYAGLLSNKQGQWGSETVVEGWIGGWRLDAADTVTIGDFDGDGKDEIFMRSAGYAGVLRYENFQLTSPTVVGGWAGGWHLSASDQSYGGDLNGDGKDDVFVRSPGYAGLLNYDGGQLGSQSVVGGTVEPAGR